MSTQYEKMSRKDREILLTDIKVMIYMVNENKDIGDVDENTMLRAGYVGGKSKIRIDDGAGTPGSLGSTWKSSTITRADISSLVEGLEVFSCNLYELMEGLKE